MNQSPAGRRPFAIHPRSYGAIKTFEWCAAERRRLVPKTATFIAGILGVKAVVPACARACHRDPLRASTDRLSSIASSFPFPLT